MEWEYQRTGRGNLRAVVDCVFKNPHEPMRYSIGRKSCVVDTGSFTCALPRKEIRSLRLAYKTKFRVTDLDGRVRYRFGWPVLVDLWDRRTGDTRACGLVHVLELGEKGQSLVGRDVLNQFVVTLNGPGRTCRIE